MSRLESLRDKLSDLSKRNRSLRLLKIYNKWSFDLSTLDKLNDTKHSSVQDIIKALFTNKEHVHLISNQTTEELGLSMNNSITSLHKNISMLEEQAGVYDLYIGYPFVSGKMMDGTYIQAPVFLFPVRLERSNNPSGWLLRLQPKEEAFLNRTLLLAFQKYNNQKIDEQILEDTKDMPMEGFQEWVSLLFKKYGIDCYWAKRKIGPLHEYRSTEIPQSPNNFVAIAPYIVLGYFSQGSTSILKDYDELLEHYEKIDDLGLVNDILFLNEDDEYNPLDNQINLDTINEKERFNITYLDSSQEKALSLAENDKGVVVHGPPGTGKSQVIVNLISNAIANKKKVLVVCQKRAALDIVHQRLQVNKLDDFAALVHNANADRKKLYRKIYRVLNNNRTKDEKIEHEFAQVCDDINKQRDYFKTFEARMVNKQDCGLTLYELYNNSKKLKKDDKLIKLDDIPNRIDITKLEEILTQLNKIGNYYGAYGHSEYPWVNRKPFTNFDYSKYHSLLKIFDDIIKDSEEIEQIKQNAVTTRLMPKDCWLFHEVLVAFINHIDDYNDKKLFSKIRLLFFMNSKAKELLNKLGYADRFKYKQFDTEIWKDIDFDIRTIKLYAEKVKNFIDKIDFMYEYFSDEYIRALIWKLEQGEVQSALFKDMQATLDEDYEDLEDMDRLIEQLDYNGKALLEIVLHEIPISNNEELGRVWVDTIRRSFYTHWIDKAERAYPNVRNISTDRFNERLEKLKDSIDKKLDTTPVYIRNILLEQIEQVKKKNLKAYKDIAYQVGKVRKIWPIRKLMYNYWDKGLLDMVPIWLVSPETVSAIFPLVKGMFDMVIFDEASQCFVENGVPSFYRAKKAIIAGDEKQLSPFDLFKVGLNDMGYDDIDENEYAQSLLTMSKRCYPTTLLSWHYRSKYEELINFSNHAFYNGLVQIAPNVMKNKKYPSIEWKDVNGVWKDRCNEIEAIEVCNTLKEVIGKYPNKSIGVITFNKKHQEIVDENIEKFMEADQSFKEYINMNMSKPIDERLFIKNIENVQGDERDIIIFSIGYARNEKGTVSANFGSLNKVGGENRLNVGITRAKEKVIVLSSIKGQELTVANSKNNGPKLFKEYLRYAHAIGNNDNSQIDAVLNNLCDDKYDSIDQKQYFDNQLHKQIYDRLIEKGYDVEVNIGCSGYKIDLAIKDSDDSETYLLGIEIDGSIYHSSKSVKEREIYRRRFLENKGWKIIRIWSRNWWKDSDKELNKIDQLISK